MARQPTISFVLRGNADRWGLKALALSFAYKYKTNYIWIGYKLKPEEWDKRRQAAKTKQILLSNGELPIRMNQVLSELRSKALVILAAFHAADTVPDFPNFKFQWDGGAPKEAPKSFFDLGCSILDLEVESKEISKNTRKSYGAALRKFEAFKPGIAIEAISRADVLAFKALLIKEQNENVSSQYALWLKIVYGKVKKVHQFNQDDPFEGVKLPVKRISEKKTLSVAEYRALYDHYKTCEPGSKPSEILRRFLIMCRGLRFSDTSGINKVAHYREVEKDGTLLRYIVKPAQKTKVSGILPITDEDAEWLMHWREDGFLFKKPDFTRYSDSLKDLTERIIGRRLTTHYGRHFAGDFALNEMGLSLDEVETVLGLSSKDMTKTYAEYNKLSILKKIYNSESG